MQYKPNYAMLLWFFVHFVILILFLISFWHDQNVIIVMSWVINHESCFNICFSQHCQCYIHFCQFVATVAKCPGLVFQATLPVCSGNGRAWLDQWEWGRNLGWRGGGHGAGFCGGWPELVNHGMYEYSYMRHSPMPTSPGNNITLSSQFSIYLVIIETDWLGVRELVWLIVTRLQSYIITALCKSWLFNPL